jgi:hypothetical protein
MNAKTKKNDFDVEKMLKEPENVVWSVIEELKDIHNFYLSNIFKFLINKKKAREHLLHQIDRLEEVLAKIEKN